MLSIDQQALLQEDARVQEIRTHVWKNHVQVGRGSWFPQHKWRDAVLNFLFAMAAGKRAVTDCPKITFGALTLQHDPNFGRYFAYGMGTQNWHTLPAKEEWVTVGCKSVEVEHALLCFVKNDRIKALCINFTEASPSNHFILLWKGQLRGAYHAFAQGVRLA